MPCRINPYVPLKEGQIRLINDGYLDNKPFLMTVDIDEAPGFCALSYCWGTENCLHVLTQSEDGLVKWVVTSALFEALSSLRRCGRRGLLWADMICINQSDDEEKQQQIPRMAEIFSQAKSVYAYLGRRQIDSHRSVRPGLDTISRIWAPTRKRELDLFGHVFQTGANTINEYVRLDEVSIENGLPPFASLFWEDVLQLVSASWWTRTWTFQESVVAQRLEFVFDDTLFEDEMLVWNIFSYVMCEAVKKHGGRMGYPSLKLQETVRAQESIFCVREANKYMQRNPLFPKDDLDRRNNALDKQEELADAFGADENRYSALRRNPVKQRGEVVRSISIFEASFGRRCTFEQDKIYSVLGLLDPDIRSDVVVNLAQSPREVFTQMASALVKRDLCGLSFSVASRKTEGLPSWVTDFAQGTRSPSLSASLLSATAGSSRSQTSFRTLADDRNRIRIQGFVLTTVTRCVPFEPKCTGQTLIFGEARDLSILRQFEDWVQECFEAARSEIPSPLWRPVPKGFFETMMFETQEQSTKRNYYRHISKTYALYTRALLACRGYLRSLRRGSLWLRRALEDDTVALVLVSKISNSFIVTADGRVGMASGCVKSGDLVCIINEADCPMILRPRKESGVFEYLHTAYIHGVMDGEALESHPPEDDVDFILD